jgi:hypothetical protein
LRHDIGREPLPRGPSKDELRRELAQAAANTQAQQQSK